MIISDFPESVGKLVRRKGEMRAGEIIGVIYTLEKELRTHKKYLPLVNTQFRVIEKGDGFAMYIGSNHFRDFVAMGEATAMILSAFDSELVRVGLEDASPRNRAPEEMSVFKNPRQKK